LGLLITAPTVHATIPSTVVVESQAWWDKDGVSIPTKVGHHIHLQATLPTGIVNGIIRVPIKITLHNQIGAVTWIRAAQQSTEKPIRWLGQTTWSTTQLKLTTPLGPCADCSLSATIEMDISKWSTGVQELRLTANIPNNSEGNRQFQSTGWPLNVRSTTCSTRCNVFWEARGWYTDRNYQNARVTTLPWNIESGGSISVRLGPGSSGLATTFSGVYIDPDFHHGSTGIWSKTWKGPFTGSMTLPPLSSGTHKLVTLASDGKNVGVLAETFIVP
jgi:hypothetical protein